VITIENFKNALISLGFVKDKKKNIFSKQCNSDLDSIMSVDFVEKKLIYPPKLKTYRETTKTFLQDENFVVFECVARLLIKGYKSEHIELEKPMPGGHHDTGGFCDILIKDNDDKTFLLIECKKADEFEVFWKKMLVNGGQLFNYYNSYRQAQALCLYTSDYTTEVGLHYTSHIVSMIDNDEYIQSDKKIRSFRQVQEDNGGKDEYFKVWKNTYQLDYNTRGVFEDDIAAYAVGKLKYTINDLIEVDNDSIQKKYHEFATILRQHNVGSHENAFDKLVNLFLAKIVDEFVNGEELQFYWKGAAYDDYFSLQDRLQKLYKEGMERFLGEQVTYIDQKEISEAFHLFKNDPDATRNKVLEYFRQLKFFTNNDFTFLDVHNETLFYQNAIILKKIVQMLEDIKLKTEERNQFLGDLFEGFLDQGVKQSEGQYFTPMPIVKFLVSSLPLENMIQNSNEIPYAIDYACGAGHFLNEYASCIKAFVEKHKPVAVEEYYKRTVGIEKEYRLSKVSKVSAFMYGQDDIQIIYGDALAKNQRIKDCKYSVLIANPPYSVKGFLETLTEEERDNYALTAYVSDISKNNSIETFFVERAKQLLRGDGIAAIVLPSSILSNGSICIPCREIIIKYFNIVAIAEFGGGTFGKTGTNTATLFLRRRKFNPNVAEHYQNRVDSWFAADKSKDIVFEDDDLIDEYCMHCEVDVDEYKNWINGGIVPTAPIFVDYRNKIINSTVYKNIQKKKITKRYTQTDKYTDLENCISCRIKSAEKEKLYYYMLAANNSCSVVVVKSPSDNKKMKEFLGYDWSGAKGNEGIKYIDAVVADDDDTISKNKGINSIKTPLFDPNNYYSNEKINTVIRQNFIDGKPFVPDTLAGYVNVYNLVDMLDFSRVDFDKTIKTTVVSKTREAKSKFKLVKLGDIAKISSGGTPLRANASYWSNGNIPWIKTQELNDKIINDTEEKITESGLKNSSAKYYEQGCIVVAMYGATIGQTAKLGIRATTNQACAILHDFNNDVSNDYVWAYLKSHKENLKALGHGKGQPNLNANDIANFKIPLPPIIIQQQIVLDCKEVDNEYDNAVTENENLSKEIEDIINGASGNKKKLSSLCSEINPSKVAIRTVSDETMVSFIEMSSVSNDGFIETKVDKTLKELRKGSYTYFAENDVIIAKITPCMENGKCALATGLTNHIGMGSSEFHVFRADESVILPAYLFYCLNRESIRKLAATQMTGKSGHRRVPISFYETLPISLPSLLEQQHIVSAIEKLEEKISANKAIMAASAERKKKIIEKALM